MSRRLQRLPIPPIWIVALVFLLVLAWHSQVAVAEPVGQKAIPHAIEGRDDCLMCHKSAVRPVPANHAAYTNAMCTTCHTVAAAPQPTAAPTQVPAQPTVPTQAAGGPKDTPHPIEGKEDCLMCHKSAVKPVPASHAAYTNTMCATCHKVAAAVQPTAVPTSPQPTAAPAQRTATPAPAQPTATAAPAKPGVAAAIPHSLEGRAACSTCHGIAGSKPYPKDHMGRPDSTCTQCHSVAPTRPAAPTAVAASVDACLKCHGQKDLSITLSGGERLSLYIDQAVFAASVHGQKGLTCVSCHPTSQQYPHPPVTAATARELNRGVIQSACATCHQNIYKDYKESVHGKALIEEKNLDVPSCTDCHGTHNIRDPRTSLFRADSPDLCSACHANARLMSKYGISANVTKTYLNDFHGATVRLERDRDPNITSYKAVCYDCHGIHNIKKTDDPTSQVVKENLVNTCRKCHPNADANFPAAWTSHYEPNLQKWPLVYFVDLFYKILIPATLGGMIAFIALDVAHTIRNRHRTRRAK